MPAQTFTDGQILTAAEMNALSTQAAGALQASSNLSDLASASAARSNLGAGTVNSVALTMPADFSVAGSPVTNAGTLAVTRAVQNPNLVQAGPASGAAAAPSFRALAAADIPPVGSAMLLQAGRFYTSNMIGGAANPGSPPTGSLISGLPIFIPQTIALQTLSCETTGTMSGTAHIRMALYSDNNGGPGAQVAGTDTGDLTQTNTVNVLTSAVLGAVLTPGWYWPVFETSGLAGSGVIYATSARPGTMGGASSLARAIQGPYNAYLMTHTYGTALPNPWVTSSESNTTNIPVIALGF